MLARHYLEGHEVTTVDTAWTERRVCLLVELLGVVILLAALATLVIATR
jgi:hypothetical protein